MTGFLITPFHHQFLRYSTTLGTSPSPQMFTIPVSSPVVASTSFPSLDDCYYLLKLNYHLLQETSSIVVLPPKFSSGQVYICSNIICSNSTIAITSIVFSLFLPTLFHTQLYWNYLRLRTIYCLWKPILDGPQFLY